MPVRPNFILFYMRVYFFFFSLRALTSCLESIHCPSTVKSHGSLILNLLHLLDLKNCDWTSSCPNHQRLLILQNLLTYWTDKNFSNEPEDNIDDYCP